MIFRLSLVALCSLAGSACGSAVGGEPVAAAGFGPTSTVTSAAGIPTPRTLAGTDLCALVTAADLTSAGGLAGEARHRTDAVPESCSFPLGGGAVGDLVLVGFYKPLDQVRKDQPNGQEEITSGHTTWVYCRLSDGYQTCLAAVAVRADRSLVVAMDKRDTSAERVLTLLQPITEKVLERLPPE